MSVAIAHNTIQFSWMLKCSRMNSLHERFIKFWLKCFVLKFIYGTGYWQTANLTNYSMNKMPAKVHVSKRTNWIIDWK